MSDMDSAHAAIRKVFEDLERRVKRVSFYRLDDAHRVVRCSAYDAMMFAADLNLRQVAYTEIAPGIVVSTVFLSGFMVPQDGDWQFFETMVRGGPCDGYRTQYMTWEEAEEGHQITVEAAESLKSC